MIPYAIHHRLPSFLTENRKAQVKREDLVGAQAAIVASFSANDIVEVPPGREPVALMKGSLRLLRHLKPSIRSFTHLLSPQGHQAERVVPQGLHLYRLSPARRHDPVLYLGIHPRQLITRGAGLEQSVACIHA